MLYLVWDLLVKSVRGSTQHEEEATVGFTSTHTQNHLNILKSIPDARQDLVFGKVAVVRKCKKEVDSLIEQLVSMQIFQQNLSLTRRITRSLSIIW